MKIKKILVVGIILLLNFNVNFADTICNVYYDGKLINSNAVIKDNISYMNKYNLEDMVGTNFILNGNELFFKNKNIFLTDETLNYVKTENKYPIRDICENLSKLVQFDHNNLNIIISDKNNYIVNKETEYEYINPKYSYRLVMPKKWKNLVTIIEKKDRTEFYQKKEYNNPKNLLNEGLLFTIKYNEIPNENLIGFQNSKYLTFFENKKFKGDNNYNELKKQIPEILKTFSIFVFSNMTDDEIFKILENNLNKIPLKVKYRDLKENDVYLPYSVIYTLDNNYQNSEIYKTFKRDLNDKIETSLAVAKSYDGENYSIEYILKAKDRIYLYIDNQRDLKKYSMYGKTKVIYNDLDELAKNRVLFTSEKEEIKSVLDKINNSRNYDKRVDGNYNSLRDNYEFNRIADYIAQKANVFANNYNESFYIINEYINSLESNQMFIFNENIFKIFDILDKKYGNRVVIRNLIKLFKIENISNLKELEEIY